MAIQLNKKIVLATLIAFGLLGMTGSVHASGLAKPPNNLGLKVYWTFNEGVGTRVIDYSSNGNHGTLVNAPVYIAGKNGHGKALDFAGWEGSVNDYVGSSQLVNTANVTVSAWIRVPAASIFNGSIAGFMNGIGNGAADKSLYVATADRKLYFYVYDGANKTTSAPTDVIPLNTWVHVVGTADGTNAKAYVNGVEVGTVAAGASYTGYTVPNFFVNGASGVPAVTGYYYNVDIDEVRMYNRALTPSQILALYQQGATRLNASSASLTAGSTLTRGLVGHWTFDGSKMTSNVTDSSVSGANGFLRNFTATTTTTGKLGQALQFDGVNDNVFIPNPSADDFGTGPMSVSAWVKSASTTAFMEVADNKTAGTNNAGFNLQIDNTVGGSGGAFFRIANGSAQAAAADCGSTCEVEDNQWHHIVGVLERGVSNDILYLYFDGVLKVTNAGVTAGWNISSSQDLILGAYLNGTNLGNLDGSLDDVRLYNRSLSSDEVKQLYRLGVGKANTSSVTLQGSSLASGLAALWTFDGPDTISTITDKSGNSKNGYFIGSATSSAKIAGKHGQALSFNGSTDYVTLGSSALGSFTNYTVSAWVKTTDSDGTILSEYQDGVCGDFIFNLNGSAVVVHDGGAATTGGVITVTDNMWHHVAATNNGSASVIYVDGVLDTTGSSVVWANNCTVDVRIGDTVSGSVGKLSGKIDDLRVYSRALSASEIKQLYRMGK